MPKICQSVEDLKTVVQSIEKKIGFHGEVHDHRGAQQNIAVVTYRFSVNYVVDRRELDFEDPVAFDKLLRWRRLDALHNLSESILRQIKAESRQWEMKRE